MLKKITLTTLTTIAAAALTACGGGGGGGTPAVANAVAVGAWQGTTANKYIVDAIALPNGNFYTMFGNAVNGGLGVVGFDIGTYSVSANNITGNITEYYATSYLTGSVAGTVSTGTSLIGTIGYSNNNTGGFTATPIPTANFNFNTPASLTSITGNWTGAILSNVVATATISSTGTFSATAGGCLFTGTLTPSSSYNYFDLTVTSGSQSTCGYQNTTYTGIAIDYAITGGKTQLLMVGQNASLHSATAFFAVR